MDSAADWQHGKEQGTVNCQKSPEVQMLGLSVSMVQSFSRFTQCLSDVFASGFT